MRSRTLTTLGPLAVMIALALPAAAGPCWTTSRADVDTGDTPAGRYYVEDDCPILHGCFLSLWIYQESNGIDGLQRSDDIVDDTCRGQIPSDTVLF